MSATNIMFAELLVVEDLEPAVRISPDLTCGSVACVVCGPVVEAAAARARWKAAVAS